MWEISDFQDLCLHQNTLSEGEVHCGYEDEREYKSLSMVKVRETLGHYSFSPAASVFTPVLR